jgi:CheY-like chemotaxis protein
MTQSLPPKSIVLYADDDKDDLQLIEEVFSAYTSIIELITFESGIQLLDYLQALDPLQPQPCLIILDINMPSLDGKQVLRQLRNTNLWKDIPVVLFTTSTLPSELAFAHSFNAGFITKPLYNQQIHKIVDQLIGHCATEIQDKFRRNNE